MYRGHAFTALLLYSDSSMPLVPEQGEEAAGQGTLHRRTQHGFNVIASANIFQVASGDTDNILKIAGTYDAYVTGTLEDEKGYCAVVGMDEIEKQDYILTPGRYVGITETEDDGEPFQEKMERLTGELSELFAKSHELEAEIKKQLASIGFTIT